MKILILDLIFTSVYLVPVSVSMEATSSNSSVTTKSEDEEIRLTTSIVDRYPQTYLEYGKYNTTLAVNSSIQMSCTVDANLSERLLWWFNGSILASTLSSPSGLEYYNIHVSYSQISQSNKITSNLSINVTQWNNTGLYRCALGDTTIMEHYLTVEDLKLRISCTSESCDHVLVANESQEYILQCYINQQPLYNPITWRIKNSKNKIVLNETALNETNLDNALNVLSDNMYLASTFNYTAKKDHSTITCSMGIHSTYITVDVLNQDENDLVFILAVGIFVFCLILCIAVVIFYCFWGRKEFSPKQECELSFSNEPYENGREEQCDPQPDVLKGNDGPSLTPVSDEWKRLCQQNNHLYGLKLLSSRYEDDVDVFWEAVFVDGNYKERFVVRSVSGKATIESLEDFRKFQVRLTELPEHPNVLKVLGCYINKLPYRVCYEYFPNKTIRDYLFEDFQNLQNSKMHDMQAQKLLCIAHGVAAGMFYLKSNQLDHVALRVEKVLYYGATICKLYDFSLRQVSEKKAKHLLDKSEALAWLGPDVLIRNKYNHLTDIWAYGVLMWELWSGGQTPYERSPRLTVEMNMKNGKVLDQPPNCPGVIYSLMLSCWKKKPSERRSYRDIITEIGNLKSSTYKNNVQEEYAETSLPGPSFYTTLDETTYDHLSTL